MDPSEYKHVVLGLIFLKYVEDAFEERRATLEAELAADGITGEQADELLESRDEYTAEGVFWVPPEARWVYLPSRRLGQPARWLELDVDERKYSGRRRTSSVSTHPGLDILIAGSSSPVRGAAVAGMAGGGEEERKPRL